MTSPSCPVSVKRSVPRIIVASTLRISPPTLVQANPVTEPIRGSDSAGFVRNLGTPRYFSTPSFDTRIFAFLLFFFSIPFACFASTISFATLRQIDAISRSRFLTPASRVYCWIMWMMASSSKRTSSDFNPCARSCLPIIWRFAISFFSCSRYPGNSIISIRSWRGGGMANRTFAVVINITFDKS